MSNVAIITDSASDLMPAQAADAGIRVVPLFVRFGTDEARAGVDITTEAFWERLTAPGAPFPATAAPPIPAFTEAFEACFAAGADAIVCPLIGSKLSATFQSATLAAGAMPDREIRLIDSATTSMSTGMAALLAAEVAATGASGAEVEAAVTAALARTDIFFGVDTLEYLKRGGRLSAARAAIGTVLSVKPVITVRDGSVAVAEQQRTRGRVRERIIELIAAGPVERLGIVYTPASTADEVAAFRDRLVAAIPGGVDPAKVTTSLIGATTGPHLGPGVLGAAFVRAA